MAEKQRYAILGIHDEKVTTVEGNFARVRFFIEDEQVDEDMPLPELPVGLPKIESVYLAMMKDDIENRYKELGGI